MPWKTSSAMEEKLRFVFEYDRDEQTMTELCRRFEVSRETGYVWLRRYRQHGAEGLAELNRAPERHPNQTAPAIEQAVLELRQAHMRWGPRKLKRILERDQPGRRPARLARLCAAPDWWSSARSGGAPSRIPSRCNMRWSRTGCGAPTSRVGSGPAMERGSI